MLRYLILLFGLLVISLPVKAQDKAHVEKLLNEATAAFKQDNYFRGVGEVQQACGMMRACPDAMPGSSYMGIAINCLEGVKRSIKTQQAKGDNTGVTQRISALQPLLQSLMEWDKNNPRWHYEKGNLLREQSMAYNNVGFTMEAVMEFKQALAINGGGAYHDEIQRQLDICQKAVAQGWENARAWDKAHPSHYSSPTIAPVESPQFCPLCGHTHIYTAPCWH